MNFQLEPYQIDLQQSIQSFAETSFAATTASREAAGTFTRDEWKAMASNLLPACIVPENLGGAGFSAFDAALALESFALGCNDGGLGFSLGAHLCAGLLPLLRNANDEQLKKMIPLIVQGDCILACALTEESAGSDAFRMKTTAIKTDSGYILHGEKHFCTNAPMADYFLVYALTDVEKGFFGGISTFLVPKNTHGLEIGIPEKKAGLHSSPLAAIYLNQVSLPDAALLGKEGSGVRMFHEAMDWERILLSALHVGAMKRICKQTTDYARIRTSGNKPIAEHQAVAFRIADMHLQTEIAALMVYQAAALLSENKPVSVKASQTKVFVSEAYEQVARWAQLVFGGAGYTELSGIPAAIRDAQAAAIYSGTNDVQRLLIASKL
ncbi:MAG: acyl-CoA dehydrogenase family protein [Bacteroidia bacterium]